MTTQKLAIALPALACIVIITAVATAAAMQPSRDRTPHPQSPLPTLPQDVAPMEYHLSAYRTDDAVILVAKGGNRTGGYKTHLELTTPAANPPEIHLRNVPPGRGVMAPQAITPFDVTGSMRLTGNIKAVRVIVAGKPEQIEVKQIKEIPPAADSGN